ncbi:hypothetical protein NE865_04011 [Phthorimaea operculella]|nr:hypothetical protein NE865_04011 [Phthorimaea operculella]
MNDSDYYNKNEKKIKSVKRFPKPRTRGIEYFDRDAHRFESSSHNILLKNGNGKPAISRAKKKYSEDMQDVWSVLKNINKLQFRPKPRISDEDSLISDRKKIITRKFRTRKGRRLIGTCRTEEVAYVADFEIQSKSDSPSSSCDRITVIDKNYFKNKTNHDKIDLKVQSPRKIPYKPKKLIPLNEISKNIPNVKASQVKDNKRFLSFTKKQNEQMDKLVTKTAANLNIKPPESVCTLVEKSIDSSNCIRMFENEPSNCSLMFNDNENSFINTINNQTIQSNKNTNGMMQIANNNTNTKVHNSMNKGPLKPRLVTTMPSAATMPKLAAAADVKRRLAHYKFPMIVLGKDEVSSNIEVLDYEPPQFYGLKNHIWPFMVEWKNKPTSIKKGNSPRYLDAITGHARKVNNEEALAKSKDKYSTNLSLVSKKNMDQKRGIQIQQETATSAGGFKKMKPIRQFKDKMLKLLYKNSHPSDINLNPNAELYTEIQVIPEKNKVDSSTEMTLLEKNILESRKNIVSANTHKAMLISAPTLPRMTITASTPPWRVQIGEQNRIPKKLDDIIDGAGKPCNLLQKQNMRIPGARPPWAKAKWASDFIENVIRKIKNGSYYGTGEKRSTINNVNLTNNSVQSKDASDCDGSEGISIQTCDQQSIEKVDFEQYFNGIMDEDIDTYDSFIKIPGFDDTLPNLEIQTLNANQIQVKNCINNVVVHFDVSMPNKKCSNAFKKKNSLPVFTPLPVTESNTRMYKCSTKILNAVLPAELCTVLPTLMQNIFDSNTNLVSSTALPILTLSEISVCDSEVNAPVYGPANPMSDPWCPCTQLQSSLGQYSQNNQWMVPQRPPIPNELAGYSPRIFNASPWDGPSSPRINAQIPSIGQWGSPYAYGWPNYVPIYISPRLINILQGTFGYSPRKLYKCSRNNVIKDIELKYSKDVIISEPHTKAIMAILVNPVNSLTYTEIKPDHIRIDKSSEVNKSVNCTALELYKPATKCIPLMSNFRSLVEKMWNYCKFNVHYALPNNILNYNTNLITTLKGDSITVDMVVSNAHRVKNTMSLTFTCVNNCVADSNNSINVAKIFEVVELPTKSEDYVSKDVSVIRGVQLAKRVKDKVKKKSYTYLYKKSKSSNFGDRCCMSLSKISNIEDFTATLGAAKSLCDVFDDNASQKVLSCVEEMKEWTNCITPGQAMLVLLLANKKVTPNILRFRPVLLQGIAVKRITRVTELDMEIEVIERENMQLSEREGITYIPASVANQDSLFDELLWIAKTTASDYQKPFDESSERLLRALLGKRKKLNPSYLRVMARYVGLGLLKKP